MQYVTFCMSKNTFPKGKPLFKCESGVTLAIIKEKRKKSLILKNCVSHTSILYSVSSCFMRRVAFNVQCRIILSIHLIFGLDFIPMSNVRIIQI